MKISGTKNRFDSRSSQTKFRWFLPPTITINNEETRVRIEQTSAVTPERLGEFVGRVSLHELQEINDADSDKRTPFEGPSSSADLG